jgi:hypothetical protein
MTDVYAVLLLIGLFVVFGATRRKCGDCSHAGGCEAADASCGSGSCHHPQLPVDGTEREPNHVQR